MAIAANLNAVLLMIAAAMVIAYGFLFDGTELALDQKTGTATLRRHSKTEPNQEIAQNIDLALRGIARVKR